MPPEVSVVTDERERVGTQSTYAPLDLWGVLKSVTKLGAGEVTSKLASFLLFAYITRVYGVGLLGVVALAQTVAMYVMQGTDQGLCLIGARIVAKAPPAARVILKPVVKKRLILCAVSVAVGIVYALWGPIPNEARFYVFGFVLAVIPYAFSLDWVAWGLNHMGWLGGWRALVTIVFVGCAILGMHWTGTTFLPLVASRIASTAVGALLLWGIWRLAWRWQVLEGKEPVEDVASKQIVWGAIFTLGAARAFALLFNNVDTLILAGLTTAKEVGRYNAAYKILFVVFSGFYLLTQSLYPRLSAAKGGKSLRRWLFGALCVVTLLGVAVAAGIWIFSAQVLTLIYGSTLGSVELLHTLLLALPMGFCVSLIAILLISRGRDRLLLVITSFAAILNVGLNFFLIPTMQAQGAAFATIFSYAFLLLMSVALVSRRSVLEVH